MRHAGGAAEGGPAGVPANTLDRYGKKADFRLRNQECFCWSTSELIANDSTLTFGECHRPKDRRELALGSPDTAGLQVSELVMRGQHRLGGRIPGP